jgi:hypothetical protein
VHGADALALGRDFAFAVASLAFALVAFTRVDVLLVLASAGVLGLSTLLRGH